MLCTEPHQILGLEYWWKDAYTTLCNSSVNCPGAEFITGNHNPES